MAAFIAEPVQGAGGMIIPPATYWPLIREVCDKHDILLIADEVITGFGRTGSMFGTRTWGVKADIMSLAKGINSGYIPLGATAVNKKVEEAWERDHPLAPIMHGYTYSGHPLACAAANANLEIIEQENLSENALNVGAYFLEKLQALKDEHQFIGDVRGKGLMVGVELVVDETLKDRTPNPAAVDQVMEETKKRGLLIGRGGLYGNTLRIAPALNIGSDEVIEALAILKESFAVLD